MNQEYILGLDCSTKTVGICLIENKNGNIELMDYIKLNTEKKELSVFEKADIIKKYIESICSKYNIVQICIEDFLKSYVGTNKNAIISLAQINSIVQYMIYSSFSHIKLSTINVRTARKKVIDKILKGKNQKEQVFEWFVENNLWEFPKTKYDNIIKEARDCVDAYIVCMGCWKYKY